MTDSDPQLLLDIGLSGSMSRDDLIVTRANRAAVALVERWPDWPGPFVVIAGPTGSGKTHLATVWREVSGAVACDPRDLSDDALDAAQAGKPILIDGVEPAGFDENALFHIMNAVRANGSGLLMTSAHWPGAWQVRTPDLRSRIQAATTVEITEPDDELLVGVMAKLFADRQIAVDPSVIAYLASRIERSLASARSVVERLDRASMARKVKITRAFAAAFLREQDANQNEFDF
ncbi:DnaA regulatory inactivator HdaA [Oricola sp.]|uniref:DnaA regulatory inactivator HdaA n=1 Tax=Oricola sp. TaxID=1979950 RepID=UPI0025D8134B|nr:DnaA regulatory inactivator HdaA [Oricola sp.]MCI5077168.1 DnaA regulatory inactivator HdaA [Oricola sp.]